MKKTQNYIIITFFLLCIFGFSAASLCKPDTVFSEEENRELAQMPKLSLDDIVSGEFSKDYDAYLSDQFVFRNQWIGVKTAAERLAGKQEVNDIYFARDDYLIEKHTGTFSDPQAAANLVYLRSFVEEQTARLGEGHVMALIAPNALCVLEDKLPAFADAREENAYLDQIRAALPAGSFVDVRDVLAEHKEEYLYYRTDHHWTTLGAWYAYETWAKALQAENAQDGSAPDSQADGGGTWYTPREMYQQETLTTEFYGTVEAKVNCETPADTIQAWIPLTEIPYTVSFNHDTQNVKDTLYDESFLKKRDKYAVFFGGNQPLTEIRTQAKTGRRLLVIKDSYANCFVPFAVQDMEQISMIDMRYFNERLSEYIAGNDFTDVLFLYNAAGFAEDVSLAKLAL